MQVQFVIKITSVQITNDNGGWGSTDAYVGDLMVGNTDSDEPILGESRTIVRQTPNDGIYGCVDAEVTGIVVYVDPRPNPAQTHE